MDLPVSLNGFIKHGVVFHPMSPEATEARAKCHHCGKVDHLYVNIETLLWHCKHCGESGDFPKFLKMRQMTYRHPFILGGSQSEIARTICDDRGLEFNTLVEWGVGWKGDTYTIGVDGNQRRIMTDIRCWLPGKKSMSSPSGHASLILPVLEKKGKRVWLCEGEWDGMAMWEILNKLVLDDGVLATPGAATFPKCLLTYLVAKDVIAAFDHDEAGQQAAGRVSRLAPGTANSLTFVQWPEDKPVGYDLRDAYKEHGCDAKATYDWLVSLFTKVVPIQVSKQVEKLGGVATASSRQPTPTAGLGVVPIRKTRKLQPLSKADIDRTFRKWLKLDTTEVLDVFFGTIFANRLAGDPIWMFFVAPPGGMKSELLMSISQSNSVISLTSLTPATLISGATMAGGGDPSLLAKLDGKVLTIKDFTAILSLNPLAISEILGTLRDVYDGEITKSWGTGLTRHYNCKFGIVAGVTPVIEASGLICAMLGERFLKYNIQHAAHLAARRNILNRALSNIPKTEQMRKDIWEVACKVVGENHPLDPIPIMNPQLWNKLVDVSLWAASLRGVVLKDKFTHVIQFKPTHEIGTRIARQLCKLAYGISIYKREPGVSIETFDTVCQVARDSIPQIVGEIIKQLFIHEPEGDGKSGGLGVDELVRWTKLSRETVDSILSDLGLLGAVTSLGKFKSTWRLSPGMFKLMSSLGFYRRETLWYRQRK